MVASGGSPAALGGRWRGGGEVNLSVNDHQAVFVWNLAALRRGAGGFSSLRETADPNHLGDRDLGGSSLYIAAGFGFRNLLGGLSDSSRIASSHEDSA